MQKARNRLQLLLTAGALNFVGACALLTGQDTRRSDLQLTVDPSGAETARFVDVEVADRDSSTVVRGTLRKDSGSYVTDRLPGHVDIEIIEPNGRSYSQHVELITQSRLGHYTRGVRYYPRASFSMTLPRSVPKHSNVLVRYYPSDHQTSSSEAVRRLHKPSE